MLIISSRFSYRSSTTTTKEFTEAFRMEVVRRAQIGTDHSVFAINGILITVVPPFVQNCLYYWFFLALPHSRHLPGVSTSPS